MRKLTKAQKAKLRGECKATFRTAKKSEPLFRSHMDAVAWACSHLHSHSSAFARRLEKDIKSHPRMTLAQAKARWERWQREQGK